MSQLRVAVVGGGLAGIAAALRCADAGARVTLIERRPHLGGLTTSIERDGLSFDNGQHVFLRCCTEYRALLERIGATEQVYLQPRLNVPVLSPDGSVGSISRANLPAPLHLALSILSYRFLSLKERLRLLGPVLALRRLDPLDPALDKVSFGEWLSARSQSKDAINRLWNLIVQPTLNVSSHDASLALAVQVFRVGFLDRSDGADMGWSKVPLSELHDANAQRALGAAGVETLLNTSVSSLNHSSSDSLILETPTRTIAVDAAIVATPPRMSASLGALSDSQLANDLGTSPIVNVHFVFDRKVTDYAMAAGIDSPVEFVFDRTDACGVTSGQCLVVSLSAADQYMGQGSSELIEAFRAALGDLFPKVREAHVVSAVVTREHAATFRAAPGVEGLRANAHSTDPRILLAGAWCNTGWPATMEGAVRSGNEAASRALTLGTTSTGKGPRDYERVPS